MEKVLFILNRYSLGGLEKVNMAIADALTDDYSITVYFQKSTKANLSKENFEVILGKKNYFLFLRSPLLLLNTLRSKKISDKKNIIFNKVEKEVDFMYFDTIILNSEDIFFAEKIKKINTGVKIIWWVHNEFDIIMNRRLKEAHQETKNNLRFVDTVVALTDTDKKNFSTLHSDVVVIKNPVTIESTSKISNLETKVISFTSRLVMEQKGLDFLVEIAKNIEPDWKISVAGDGPDRDKFLRLIKKENVTRKFIIRGALEKQELKKHYLNSSIFISTSRWEGFGLVITEAMSFGLPIISFDNHGPHEILSHNEKYGELIPKYDVNLFSAMVNMFCKSKEIRKEYSQKSLQRIKDYALSDVLKQWKELL